MILNLESFLLDGYEANELTEQVFEFLDTKKSKNSSLISNENGLN